MSQRAPAVQYRSLHRGIPRPGPARPEPEPLQGQILTCQPLQRRQPVPLQLSPTPMPITYVAGISPYPAAGRPVSTGPLQRNSPSALPGLFIGTEHRLCGYAADLLEHPGQMHQVRGRKRGVRLVKSLSGLPEPASRYDDPAA